MYIFFHISSQEEFVIIIGKFIYHSSQTGFYFLMYMIYDKVFLLFYSKYYFYFFLKDEKKFCYGIFKLNVMQLQVS